jgi:hypothetical protein
MKFIKFLLALLSSGASSSSAAAADFAKNEEVRSALRQSGDDTRIPRSIQHFAYFPGEQEQRAYRELVVSRGYEIDDEHSEAEAPYAWAIKFSKMQAPNDVDEETSILDADALRLKGQYDGWETEIVRRK